MIYFSQLDIFRLFMRALRRGDYPTVYTRGFNPHPQISFTRALKLGLEGEIQTVFYFEEEIDPERFKNDFSRQVPCDLEIVSIEPVKK
ncbi:MAG: DUF2344 domain-containing protein [Candidatus Omnitrophica bacterium]|nr:DUF2344 domain-containing protein [Candidatus Omnitrophota bacterium]